MHKTGLKRRALTPVNRNLKKPLLTVVLMALGGTSPGWAEQASIKAMPFELGTITVSATPLHVGEIGEDQVASVVTQKEMRQFNRDNVGDALNLLSGVTLSNNSRNEKMISVRGFDSRQVPLFIDGIPVYVPYDGYVDFNRFTTADLAAIQLAKGFSSVAYGPNAIGGAINLISRKPKATFEGDASVGFGSGNERLGQANVGTNQGKWYLQAGVSHLESDYFPLSSDFRPTATENGGKRNNSYRKDDKLSLKVGLTPNASDEYTISYYKQDGEKGQPESTDPAAARYWKWPYWNKESLYFISKTTLGSSEAVKFRLYHDKFDNEVDSYTDGTYSTLKTSGLGSVATGRSIYNDRTSGGSIELESVRFRAHTVRLVTHYKTNEHTELDAFASTTTIYKDTLVSYAAEDNIKINSVLNLSLGLAHHQLRPDTVFNLGNPYSLPSAKSANNAQAGLFYDWSERVRFYTTVAQKTRLPTLKDRYSQRLGSFIENPDLQPEQSINYEIGYQGRPWQGAKAEAAIYYSDISDKIQSQFVGTVASSCISTAKCQMQNIGRVHASGIELGLRSPVLSWMELGGNYTYTDLKNVSDPTNKVIDVPRQKLTANAIAHLNGYIDLVGFVEHNSSRWVSNTMELAGFTTMNLKGVYRPTKSLFAEVGVNNLADKNYSLANGFPNPGRMWFAKASYQF
ncbi:TonB-dependent receptor [Candidatus Nitrotoga arctica]|uniref:TonB-dependent receptor n=2 Tax=Candidatus Nitrotoga arctica TaxID=453162 RepID=A0ABM8Z1C6_9PROT|nr:TonB-dependent receptor [Candidatus Nitrotoga arctica]